MFNFRLVNARYIPSADGPVGFGVAFGVGFGVAFGVGFGVGTGTVADNTKYVLARNIIKVLDKQ